MKNQDLAVITTTTATIAPERQQMLSELVTRLQQLEKTISIHWYLVNVSSTGEQLPAHVTEAVKNTTILHTEPDGTPATGRNHALAMVEEKAVVNIDDDDYPDEHLVEVFAQHCKTQQEERTVCTSTPSYDLHGNVSTLWNDWGNFPTLVAGGETLKRHLTDGDAPLRVHPSSIIFSTELLREIGGWDPEFNRAGEDIDLALHASTMVDAWQHISTPWLHYRRHNKQMTSAPGFAEQDVQNIRDIYRAHGI